MGFFDIWLSLWAAIGGVSTTITAWPVISPSLWFGQPNRPTTPPPDPVPGLLEELRGGQRDIVENQMTIVENQTAIVEGQKAIIEALKVITDELRGSRGDLTRLLDGMGGHLQAIKRATESSAEILERLSEPIEEVSRRHTAQSEPATERSQTQDTCQVL